MQYVRGSGSRGRSRKDAEQWNGPQVVESGGSQEQADCVRGAPGGGPSDERQRGERDAGVAHGTGREGKEVPDAQRCAYDRHGGKRCPLPGTVTAVGSVPARGDDQRATYWCWWHVPDQRAAAGEAEGEYEWARWIAGEARAKFIERYPRVELLPPTQAECDRWLAPVGGELPERLKAKR